MSQQGQNLFNKVWEAHKVRELPGGQTQLLVGTHLIHEVTSPQAFAMLRELGAPVRFPNRTFATVDHIIPTEDQSRPLADPLAESMLAELERNCAESGIRFFGPEGGHQGVVRGLQGARPAREHLAARSAEMAVGPVGAGPEALDSSL